MIEWQRRNCRLIFLRLVNISSQSLLENISKPVHDRERPILREGQMVFVESTATDEELARLGLFPGEMVYSVDRIRGHGEQLLMEKIRLAAAPFPRLQNPVPRISALADTYGLRLGEALERVYAVPASPRVAKALGVAEGTLLLTLDRVVHLRDGRPLKWLCVTYSSGLENLARLIGRLGI